MEHEVYLALVEHEDKLNYLYKELIKKGILEKPREERKDEEDIPKTRQRSPYEGER